MLDRDKRLNGGSMRPLPEGCRRIGVSAVPILVTLKPTGAKGFLLALALALALNPVLALVWDQKNSEINETLSGKSLV